MFTEDECARKIVLENEPRGEGYDFGQLVLPKTLRP